MKKVVKKYLKIVSVGMFFLVSVLMFNGCRVSDIKNISIDVHDANVNNDSCIKYMQKSLMVLPSNKHIKVVPSKEDGVVIVTYDAMAIGKKNIEDTLAQCGFNAGEYKASASVRSTLPSDWFVKQVEE